MVLDARIINIVPAKGKFKIYEDPTIAPYPYLAVVDEYVDNAKVGHTFTRADIAIPWTMSKGQRRKISNRLKLMSTRGVLSIVGKKGDLILFEKVKP